MTLANAGGPVGTAETYKRNKEPWYLTPGDGHKTVTVTFTDLSGNTSPTMAAAITVDTHGPTITRAGGGVGQARRRRRRSAIACNDNLAPQVAVTIRLLDKNGNIVKVFMAPKVATGTALHHFKFVCKLKAGSYLIRAWAIDLAGNHQLKVGANTLTVK